MILNVTSSVYSSTQKPFDKPLSKSMVLAIYCKDLFFLSITPFCWGVLGEEKLWEMSFSLQKFSKAWFSNSPPWSDLMEVMQKPFSSWTLFKNILKASQTSSLRIKNINHVNLGKSSKMTRLYFLPPKLTVLVGPKRLRCKSSSGLVVETTLLLWKELSVCLPLWQNSQIESLSKLILG